MKHPALARMLSVILAILCLIMFLAGYSGRGKAEEEYAAALMAYEKLMGYIETYQQLSEKLEGLTGYSEANEDFEQRLEAHDSAASQHRTDVAEHTATEGGYIMGADTLWEKKAEVDAALAELNLAQLELDGEKSKLDQSQQQINSMQTLAAQCAQAAQLLPTLIAPSQPQLNDPTHPGDAPQQPPAPVRTDYDEGQDGDAAFQAAELSYTSVTLPDYNTKLAEYNTALGNYNTLKAQDDAAMEVYQTALTAYQDAVMGVQTAKASGLAILSQFGMPAPSGSDETVLMALSVSLNAAAQQSQQALDTGKAALTAAQTKIDEARASLEGSASYIQGSLELIWYNLGKLEDEAVELAEDRDGLTGQSADLQAEQASLEQQKADENKLNSTRLILLGHEGIKSRYEQGEELLTSARSYSEEYLSRLENEHSGRLLRSTLALVGGLLGLLCIPSGFEKLKSRFWLILPALVSFLCAAAGEYISVRLELGSFYAALPVLIFAPLFLLFSLPRKKVIKSDP